MDQFNLALALIAGTVVISGLFSQPIKRSPLQEPLLAVAVGVVIGPQVTGLIDLGLLADPLLLLEEAARITLAVALMAMALRIAPSNLRRLWQPALVLVTLGAVGMWASVWLLVMVTTGLPAWLAALIAATVTPTDPVVASAIVTGPVAERLLPERLRATLSLEAGTNDGLAYMIVLLPLPFLLVSWETTPTRWLLDIVLLGVVAAGLLGVLVGWMAAKALHWAQRRSLIESYSYLTFTIAVSLFVLGLGHVLGAESLLSVFAAGLAFDFWSDTRERYDEERVQEGVGKLCTLPVFVLFGGALPVTEWLAWGWPLALLGSAVLALRRLPTLLLLRPLLSRWLSGPDIVFLGWFGPLGVAAIFYAAYATRLTGLAEIWVVTSALIFASVVAHGVTAVPFCRFYASRNRSPEGPRQ